MHSQLKGKYINFGGITRTAYAIRRHLIMLGEVIDFGRWECLPDERYIHTGFEKEDNWGTFGMVPTSFRPISLEEFFNLKPETQPASQPLEASDLEQRYDILLRDYDHLKDALYLEKVKCGEIKDERDHYMDIYKDLMDDYNLLRDNYNFMEDELDDALCECKQSKNNEAELLETISSLREENEKHRQDAQGLRKILSDTQGFLNRVY